MQDFMWTAIFTRFTGNKGRLIGQFIISTRSEAPTSLYQDSSHWLRHRLPTYHGWSERHHWRALFLTYRCQSIRLFITSLFVLCFSKSSDQSFHSSSINSGFCRIYIWQTDVIYAAIWQWPLSSWTRRPVHMRRCRRFLPFWLWSCLRSCWLTRPTNKKQAKAFVSPVSCWIFPKLSLIYK